MKIKAFNKNLNIFIVNIIFILLFVYAPNVFSVNMADNNKHILILNSYHNGYGWTNDITENIVEKIISQYPYSNIHIEYMDTKRNYEKEYLKKLKEIYRYKFKNIVFDAIITVDDNAFNFMKETHDELFLEIPVVFCGVNCYQHFSGKKLPWLTGVNEETDIIGTIDIALKIKPETKKIFDNTVTGKRVKGMINKRLSQYANPVEFVFNDDVTFAELQEIIRKLTPEYSVIYVLFLKDKTGKTYNVRESIFNVSKESRAPVYGLWDFYLGYGIVGGNLISGKFLGKTAGGITVKILNGVKVSDIPVEYNNLSQYMFDYKQLKKHGIELSVLPENSTIINSPITFYDKHKNVIIPAYIGIGFLIFVILILLINIVRRKKAEYLLRISQIDLEQKVENKTKELKENLIKYQTLFNLSPTGILLEDGNGIIINANETTCKQMGYSKEELVGKHIKIFAPPKDEKFILNNIKYIMSGQKLVHTVESKTKNGETRYFDLSESKIALGGGKEGIIVVSVDITERKKIEDALERARILLQYSLEQIPAGVQIAESKDVQIVLANNEASDILGQSIDNMYKISVKNQSMISWKHFNASGEAIHIADLPLPRTILKGEITQNLETLIKRADGTERWILSNATPVKNHNDEIIAGITVFTDITKIKDMENEREKLIVDLKNALEEVKALSGLLPICSHCKKIRDDKGYWNQIESYISDHSDAQFSHGICPDCVQELYPEYYKKLLDNKKE